MKSKTIKNTFLILLFLAMIVVIFSMSKSFAYWLQVLGDDTLGGVNIELGEWANYARITVSNNQSDDYPAFYIFVEKGESLGDDMYNEYLANLQPNPKTHVGVDHTKYTFDDWYLSSGTTFKKNQIINEDIVIYPSWTTTLFSYVSSSQRYNVQSISGLTYTGDLYIPGWRYKGREINSVGVNAAAGSFRNIEVLSLSIGDGIKSIAWQSFSGVTASSLYLGEGLVQINQEAFLNANIPGSLKMPSTIETLGPQVFINNKFDGELDLTEACNLNSIPTKTFLNVPFSGSLCIGPEIESIGQEAFSKTNFTGGTLDLTNATSLRTIGTNAFSGTGFIGELYIGPSVVSIADNAFASTNLTALNMYDASSLVSIGKSAFATGKLEELIFPNIGVLESIGTSAFQTNSIVGDIVLPSGLITIAGVVFYGNAGITSIFIPSSVESIGGTFSTSSNSKTIFYVELESLDPLPAGWAPKWNYYNNTVICGVSPPPQPLPSSYQ